MAEMDKELVLDLERLNLRAESLRGTPDWHIGSILTARAANVGFDSGTFTLILFDNIRYWHGYLHAAEKRSAGWGVALGTQGRNAPLPLEGGKLDTSRRMWSELLVVGYLSRLEVVEVEVLESGGVRQQTARGITEGVETSLVVADTFEQIWASGFLLDNENK